MEEPLKSWTEPVKVRRCLEQAEIDASAELALDWMLKGHREAAWSPPQRPDKRLSVSAEHLGLQAAMLGWSLEAQTE